MSGDNEDTAKNFNCNTCGKKFTLQSNLSRHKRIHKLFRSVCNCGLSFSRRDGLVRHQLLSKNCKAFKQSLIPDTLDTDTSLSNICYSQIRDDFWYATYGPFQVVMMKKTGFINATKLCSLGGKDFSRWSENKSSQELIQALNRHRAQENTHDTMESSNSTLEDANTGIQE